MPTEALHPRAWQRVEGPDEHAVVHGSLPSTVQARFDRKTLRDDPHLSESSPTRTTIRRGAYLRRFAYDFIRLCAPHLTREVVEAAMRGGGSDYEL